jgi:ATP-binding cassette, subfamily B, bacterial
MQNLSKQTFKIFWNHLLKYKWVVLFIFVSIIIASVAGLLAPIYYKDFFDILTTADILDPADKLKSILIKILIVYAVSWMFWRTATFANAGFQTKAMADLSNTCFAYLHKHSVTFFNNNFVGALVKKVNRFSRSFEDITDVFMWDLLPIIINIGMVVVILSRRNIILGLAILIWVFIYMIVNYFFSIYKLKYDIERSEANSRITAVLADTITNHLNVRLFGGYKREIKLFAKENKIWQKISQFCWNLANYFESVQGILMIGLEIGIMYYAISLWQKGILTIGDFVLIQTYLFFIIHRLWNFGRIIRRYYERMAEAQEMTEIFATPHEITDVRNARELKVTDGNIDFKNVDFYYHKTRRVISDLDLDIKAKEKIALIGASGSGKSTIINLLLRNYEISRGKILIDGQKITRVTQESLWDNIALVNQDSVLFHRTLSENIAYGNPKATKEQVIKAAKLANAHNFINNLPEKYDTYVGERGIKLSGGERQRVAIARAILKNAPILVLDEATSSLDSASEQLIQGALENLMKDKTVIVIAHRLSTIMKMDRIIVLDKGRIIEQGNHQSLTNKPQGLYKKLWEKQVGGFIE